MKNILQTENNFQKNLDTALIEKVLKKYSTLSFEKQALVLEVLDGQINQQSDEQIKDLFIAFRALFCK